MQAEFEAHRRKLFAFDHQFTYGLTNFDDKTISETLHVDQAARLRPALLVQYGMHGLGVRDVHRADILSRLEPPALEEVLAKKMELRRFEQKRLQRPSGVTDCVEPPSKETLVLMAELEKVCRGYCACTAIPRLVIAPRHVACGSHCACVLRLRCACVLRAPCTLTPPRHKTPLTPPTPRRRPCLSASATARRAWPPILT